MESTPQPSKKKKRWVRRVILGLAAAMSLYVGSYIVLSMTGGWIVSESGELRIILAVSDIFLWQPRHGQGQWFRHSDGETGFRGDMLGTFYAPLILLDQCCIHRTIRFLRTDGTFVEPLPAPPFSEYHRLRVNRFHGRWPYEVPAKVGDE